ncbi:MAG TPA: hypothetical protein VLE73_06770 [Candidatus Saccharimonadales bacterium]|nr:hypothetical protein [Candidatus Saccharimonadales bacterium]
MLQVINKILVVLRHLRNQTQVGKFIYGLTIVALMAALSVVGWYSFGYSSAPSTPVANVAIESGRPSASAEQGVHNTATTATPQPSPAPSPSQAVTPSPTPQGGTSTTPAFAPVIDSTAATKKGTVTAVPYNIIYKQAPTTSVTVTASLTSSPADASGVTCKAAPTNDTSGSIEVTITETATPGDYTCRLYVTNESLTKTDDYRFTIPTPSTTAH